MDSSRINTNVLKTVAWLVILPLDFIFAFGILFTAKQLSPMSYLFLLFACIFDIPAIILLHIRERIGSIILLINASVSLVIAGIFFWVYAGLPNKRLWLQLAMFWVPKMVVGVGILAISHRRNKANIGSI